MEQKQNPTSNNSKNSAQFSSNASEDNAKSTSSQLEIPSINLPKGGGAIKNIDEKFSVNAVNGSTSFSIPLPVSDARGFTPSLSLNYNSGNGNGVFGLGWAVAIPSIKRKTEKELPQYLDEIDSDTYLLSEAEDLVPEFKKDNAGNFILNPDGSYQLNESDRNFFGTDYHIRCYKPRIEGLFSVIERWTEKNTGYIHWRTISKTNVISLFGKNTESRISDPINDKKIFEWMLEFSFDDKGNCIYYQYKPENDQGLDLSQHHNKNRKHGSLLYSNTYLKKVLYGVRLPYKNMGEVFSKNAIDYFFEALFDYGEHDPINAPFNEIKNWDFRSDAFSNYRAGFEIRSTRLCKRVMLFHHFAELPGGSALVKSLDLTFDNNGMDSFTFLKEATIKGYIKQQNGTYTYKALPPHSFAYQKHEWNTKVEKLSEESLVHLPSGIDESSYHFVDLYSEGLSGILTEQGDGWFYKTNLGEGNFTQSKLVAPRPSFSGLRQQVRLMELEGNGVKQLVQWSDEPQGFFELSPDEEWQPFKSFEEIPNIDHSDATARLLDLDGDGLADMLITEHNIFSWYPSKGKKGFGASRKVFQSFDEEKGPAIVFNDGTETIFLADMDGDGMTDIVRIRNGEVCYWPNLGYGKFGTKISMDDAPVFDYSDCFNPSFIKLADIDGSGTSDIIYLGKNNFSIFLNRQGNSFAQEIKIDSFPDISNNVQIDIIDLLGTGLSCFVWNSSLPQYAGIPLRYIDLMNSKKPHIMVSYKNNLGKEVSMEYLPSTKFYVNDKLSGKPWITKLHFPVYCISKTETRDTITGTSFVSTYNYHHGYYDHVEREFRGFGMAEQTDTEHFEHWAKGNASNIVDQTLHQQPVLTKTWFHTGAFFEREEILNQFATEYWYEEMNRQGFAVAANEFALPDAKLVAAPNLDPSIIDKLTVHEWREAFRACKSMVLRSEMFALDAPLLGATSDQIKKQLTPFTVAAHNCIIEVLQPKGQNKHAVFVVKESEAITYSYERITEDPRIAHTLNIKLDEYANILESASVVYPRAVVDLGLPVETRQTQAKTLITYLQNNYTNDIINNDVRRLRLLSETKTFELKGVTKTGPIYSLADFNNILNVALPVHYHEINVNPLPGNSQKRLIEHVRQIYYKNDLTGALALNQLESRAISFETYQLAYTPELLNDIFGAKANDALMLEGKFIHSEGDNNWWIRSGTIQFIEGVETLANAINRFFKPISYTDPYGSKTKVKYFSNYFLFIEETEDELHNIGKVLLFNMRTLSPQRMMDANDNISEVLTDELGLVKATAVFGKGNEADDLTGLNEFTTPAEAILLNDFLTANSSVQLTASGKDLLKHGSTRFVYDMDRYINSGGKEPALTATIVREEHFKKNNNSPVQISFEYSNGLGQVIMKKVQAEPGAAKQVTVNPDDTYTISTIDTSLLIPVQLRWIGNGRTVLNNKGNPVKQYEPYFSVTHKFEDLKELVETGVTPILYYDALSRLMKSEFPDGTFSKTEFDSWKQILFDQNDTALESSWYNKRFNHLIDAELIAAGKDPVKEKEAAERAAKHANTPSTQHLDTLGKSVLLIEHNGKDAFNNDILYFTQTELDIEGNARSITDARGNKVMQHKFDMLSTKVYQGSMDAGKRWLLINNLGKPLRTWDERNHEFQYFYDILHRPIQSKILGGDGDALLDHVVERNFYGETEANSKLKNLRGKIFRQYDTGGMIETPEYDFKGDPKSTTRKLFKNYKTVANWIDANLITDIDGREYTFITETDAVGRITKQTAPDGSIIIPSYNEAGLLNSETVSHINPAITTTYLKNIDYDEKGQRSKIIYGNDVLTKFYYDKETFRLRRLETKRQNNDPLQDLYYTFDPVGNVTHIEDKNIPVVFFNNQKIAGISSYTYDALYRLVEATGRENDAALTFNNKDNWNDSAFTHQMNPGDPMAVRNYTQTYQYDSVANLQQMKHVATGNNWTRDYNYQAGNNRLSTTQIGADIYTYPPHTKHGFMTAMPHLEDLGWNFKEEVVKTVRQRRLDGGTPETTYYQYDGQGQRIRKITENTADAGEEPTQKEERIYISGYEIYAKYSGANAGLQRSSLSLIEKQHRFVMIETRNDIDDGTAKQLVRYQLNNHIGSANLELDTASQVISYEEYHPFGTTAYLAKNAAINSAAKRYRYTGMERDEETGLEYHSARYYLPWLGRWCSADLLGTGDGLNLYGYSKNNPIKLFDPKGLQAWDRFVGGLKMVGGALETAAGASLVAAGAATSEIGIGIPIAAAGVLVTAHGADTTVSGARTMWNGRPVDSFTSQGLQAAGMSRGAANLTDAGISVVGTLGANLATRAPAVAAVVAEEGASAATPSVSLAFRPALGPGHNMVGVTTEAGTTTWSHLVVGAPQSTSGIVTGGEAFVVAAENGPSAAYSIIRIPVTAAQADSALATSTSAILQSSAAEASGAPAAYGLLSNSCSTYAATVLDSAGVVTPPITSPFINYASAALQSSAVMQPVTIAGVVVNMSVAATTVPDALVTPAHASVSVSRPRPAVVSSTPAPTFTTDPDQANVCVSEPIMSASVDYSSMVCR